ncbi:MAG: cytochrome P450 [Acidimicrobiia bacterium]
MSTEGTTRDRLGLDQAEWVRTYDLAHEVLRSGLFQPALHSKASAPLFGDSVITLEGREHLTRRRTELPLFSWQNIERYQADAVGPALRQELEAQRAAADGRTVDVDLIGLVRLALLRATATILGVEGVVTSEDAARLQQISDIVGVAAVLEFSTLPVAETIAQAMAARDEFVDRYYRPAHARTAAEVAAGALDADNVEGRANLLELLLARYPGWDDDALIRECLFFLTASANTSSNAAPHLFGELARWFEAHPEDRPLIEDAGFMQRAASEALRLHPPVPALLRRALEDVELSDGRTIAEGALLAVGLLDANRDPTRFGPDADRFDPHRVVAGKVHPYGMSFGMGPHACPGRPVAVGSGHGRDTDTVPMGIVVMVTQELFRQGARLSEQPPTVRDGMMDVRYARFPITLPPA